MNGGYLMISKNDSDIYAKAQKALVLGKPILFYENSTTCYYIDTISGGEITTEIVDDEEITSYGDIILTKGGKTITITSANAVSESGDIQPTIPHLYRHYIIIENDGEDTEFVCIVIYNTNSNELIDLEDIDFDFKKIEGYLYNLTSDTSVSIANVYVDNNAIVIQNVDDDTLTSYPLSSYGEELSIDEYITQIF